MQPSAPSSSNNFSAIARRLLLKRQTQEGSAPATSAKVSKTEGKPARSKRILPFSSEENRYLIASFLANYHEYYGHHCFHATKTALQYIKIGFLEKWAEDLSVLRSHRRTPLQVFDKLKKNIYLANLYIKAYKRYQTGEISQLPNLQSYLEPLVAKFLEEEQLQLQGSSRASRNFLEDFNEVMPVRNQLEPDEEDVKEASNSVDDELFAKEEWSGEKEPSRIRRARLTYRENQHLIASLLANYDVYYGLYNTGYSRIDQRIIKEKFHQKWAEEMSTLTNYSRTAAQIHGRVRKSITIIRRYVKAVDKYGSGDLSEVPRLPTHLEPLVSKVREHMTILANKSSNVHDDKDVPMDHSPSPDEIDAIETGSSVDDEHSREAACSEVGNKTKDNKTSSFTADEDQHIVSWLLENYDEYYGCNCTERDYSSESTGNSTDDYDEMMDQSLQEDETDGFVASSSIDDGPGMAVLFAPVSDSKTASETSVVFLPSTDHESKPPAEQAALLLPGSDSGTAEESAVYLPPFEEERKPPAEQHAAALLLQNGDDEEPADTVTHATALLSHDADVKDPSSTATSAFDLIPEEVLGVRRPDDETGSYGSDEDSYMSDYLSDFDPFAEADKGVKQPRNESDYDQLSQDFHDVKPEISCFDSEEGSSANGCKEQMSFPIATVPRPVQPKSLCDCLRNISAESLKAVNSDPSRRPPLGRKTRVMVRRVRQFFEEIKKILGDSCEGTILSSTVELTAWACGVTPDTVTRVGMRPDFVYELLPRAKKKIPNTKRDERDVVKRHAEKWGAVIRDFIENRLPQDHMTTLTLHSTLRRSFSDFTMGIATLKYLLHDLGVKFVKNNGKQRMIFES
ncbi:hypothetical protein Y032_0074g846 [Ancylostoma ceylanicum]|uniref:Uncharacterized protein n=1 Tax=Ancylostoma ceylanicum TaxID=53326 RepID=A0A016TVC5_9BILA|nr:hypothetical protein Y032_0074g846 [Ancylostoma ceylanicum]